MNRFEAIMERFEPTELDEPPMEFIPRKSETYYRMTIPPYPFSFSSDHYDETA